MAHRAHGWDNEYQRQREEAEKMTGDQTTQGAGRKMFQPFEEARDWARRQGLKNYEEFWRLARSGARPADIPANPDRLYRGQWKGLSDWLGLN